MSARFRQPMAVAGNIAEPPSNPLGTTTILTMWWTGFRLPSPGSSLIGSFVLGGFGRCHLTSC